MSSLSDAQFEADLTEQVASRVVTKADELLEKARNGDRAAYGQIVSLYQDRLRRACAREHQDQPWFHPFSPIS